MKRNLQNLSRIPLLLAGGALVLAAPLLSGCSTAKKIFAAESGRSTLTPIQNPFADYAPTGREAHDPIVLRTKKGDRSVEVELPKSSQNMTDFVIPVAPHFKDGDGGRAPASGTFGDSGVIDERYTERGPTAADREIAAAMPQGAAEDDGARREIETGLGLTPAEDSVPERDRSYLAAVDHVKQLYRLGRYEAALMETDDLIRMYQTDPKLYQMRGTLLDRLGKTELAIKSWNQALRFDPKNQSLRRFLERRQQNRSLATP